MYMNMYNFLSYSARKNSSALCFKKVEVGTCLVILRHKCLPDSFSQQHGLVILGVKLSYLVYLSICTYKKKKKEKKKEKFNLFCDFL